MRADLLSRQEEGGSELVRLVLEPLVACLGLGVEDEMAELVRCVPAREGAILLVCAQDDDWAAPVSLRERVQPRVAFVKEAEDRPSRLEQSHHVGHRSRRDAPSLARRGSRLLDLLSAGMGGEVEVEADVAGRKGYA